MFYVVYGSDREKSRKKLHDLLNLAQKKRPGAEIFKLNSENWNEAQFEELLHSQGLFETKYTVVLDNLFENKEAKTSLVENLDELKDSDQIFLMLEGNIDAATLKKVKVKAEQVQEFAKVEGKKEMPSIFTIADGILAKDKKKLWISYIDFISRGIAPEEIHGIFFWQVKNLILASHGKTQAETGLSPFVYRNALAGVKNYKTEELVSISNNLVHMTHKVRQGEGDLTIMLEKWILEL